MERFLELKPEEASFLSVIADHRLFLVKNIRTAPVKKAISDLRKVSKRTHRIALLILSIIQLGQLPKNKPSREVSTARRFIEAAESNGRGLEELHQARTGNLTWQERYLVNAQR